MHHGTCVTHMPWCISRSLTSGGGENVPGIPGACATCNFTYLARGQFNCPPLKDEELHPIFIPINVDMIIYPCLNLKAITSCLTRRDSSSHRRELRPPCALTLYSIIHEENTVIRREYWLHKSRFEIVEFHDIRNMKHMSLYNDVTWWYFGDYLTRDPVV